MRNQITKCYPFVCSPESINIVRRCMNSINKLTCARMSVNYANKKAGEIFELTIIASPFDICLIEAVLAPYV